MSDTVQIPEDKTDWKGLYELAQSQSDEWARTAIKRQARIEGLEHQLKLFRRKLSNITLDELLKNTGIILELFDEHFK